MKIAIIGAGLAGMSCAHELEQNGVTPVVFEDLNYIGDRESHVSAILSVVDRPINNVLNYFKEICHLEIKPINVIKKITHFSANNKYIVKGNNLGYFFIRGTVENSVKLQLHSQLTKTKIILGQKPNYKSLSKEFDFVMVANALPGIPMELGCWDEQISGWIRGATVYGDFDANELIMWLDRRCCKNGYAYLCPFDNKRAALVLFVPYINQEQLEYYWKRFLDIAEIKYKIAEEFSIEHFCGYVYPHKVGNIYLAGGAGGALSPFLGFGQLNSITMGVLAAKSIVQGLDYETLVKEIIDKEKSYYEIRKAFDKLSNKGYDNLFAFMGFPGIKHLIYYTDINVVKYSAIALRLKNKLFKEK